MALKSLIYKDVDVDGDERRATFKIPSKEQWAKYSNDRFEFKRSADQKNYDIEFESLATLDLFDELVIDFEWVYQDADGNKVPFGISKKLSPEGLAILQAACGVGLTQEKDFIPQDFKLKAIQKVFADKEEKEAEIKNA